MDPSEEHRASQLIVTWGEHEVQVADEADVALPAPEHLMVNGLS